MPPHRGCKLIVQPCDKWYYIPSESHKGDGFLHSLPISLLCAWQLQQPKGNNTRSWSKEAGDRVAVVVTMEVVSYCCKSAISGYGPSPSAKCWLEGKDQLPWPSTSALNTMLGTQKISINVCRMSHSMKE